MGTFERFAKYYDLIYKSVMNYEKECDALEKIFANFSGSKVQSILDVACGTGSHALVLSKRGYTVIGIDVSKSMIRKAKKKAEKEGIEAAFFVQDMRKIELDRKFDCAICMFGGFGFIPAYEDLVGLFSGLKQHLNKDGLFVFQFWNIGGIKPSPYRTWLKAQDENTTVYRLSETNFDSQTNIINLEMNFLVTSKDKLVETFSELYRIRCYTLAELRQYLGDNGFTLLSAYDWDMESKTELAKPRRENFGILAVARKC